MLSKSVRNLDLTCAAASTSELVSPGSAATALASTSSSTASSAPASASATTAPPTAALLVLGDNVVQTHVDLVLSHFEADLDLKIE